MLTLKECRQLTGAEADHYTDEELNLMIEFLTELATITVTELKKQQDEKESSLNDTCKQR